MEEKNDEKKKGVGLALSGGGSRAIAFHYGMFETLHELKVDKKIDVISAISGGAVIGALWSLYSNDWKVFSEKVEFILESGKEASILKKLFHPNWFFSQICRLGLDTDVLADVLDEKVFNGIKLIEIPQHPVLILNATDLKTGINFKFSKTVCGSYKDGSYILPDLRLSQAVACSAAYPLFFSAKKLQLDKNKYVFLTDGGAYDCIGANALMPDKENNISILIQDCETIITSDASSPYPENRKGLTKSTLNALYASFLASANRNRSLIYNKLYLLHQNKEIPFLGTIKMDSKHPDLKDGWDKTELEFINGYKTNFKPVRGKAIKFIKKRGKESAEFVITHYLKHLITD